MLGFNLCNMGPCLKKTEEKQGEEKEVMEAKACTLRPVAVVWICSLKLSLGQRDKKQYVL